MVRALVDLVSIYKCPTTNIAAANITVNRAFASWWTSFISPHRYLAGHEATTMLSVAAHIRQAYVRKSKPGPIRFKMRKDHRRLAIRTERTLASRFSMKKRGDRMIEHNTLPLVRRERDTLSHR
jgi:hypothetical protein